MLKSPSLPEFLLLDVKYSSSRRSLRGKSPPDPLLSRPPLNKLTCLPTAGLSRARRVWETPVRAPKALDFRWEAATPFSLLRTPLTQRATLRSLLLWRVELSGSRSSPSKDQSQLFLSIDQRWVWRRLKQLKLILITPKFLTPPNKKILWEKLKLWKFQILTTWQLLMPKISEIKVIRYMVQINRLIGDLSTLRTLSSHQRPSERTLSTISWWRVAQKP